MRVIYYAGEIYRIGETTASDNLEMKHRSNISSLTHNAALCDSEPQTPYRTIVPLFKILFFNDGLQLRYSLMTRMLEPALFAMTFVVSREENILTNNWSGQRRFAQYERDCSMCTLLKWPLILSALFILFFECGCLKITLIETDVSIYSQTFHQGETFVFLLKSSHDSFLSNDTIVALTSGDGVKEVSLNPSKLELKKLDAS